MTRTYLLPYQTHSRSAKALSRALGIPRLRTTIESSNYTPNSHDIIVNWGNNQGWPRGVRYLNNPDRVRGSTNKLTALTLLDGLGPPFTTDLEEASQWDLVVQRDLLRASGGRGMKVIPGSEITPAPLYVKYERKNEEYRIHVFGDKVIDTQRKIARPGGVPTNWQIRSHGNGFIFARESGDPPANAIEYAISAVNKVGLDFAAVDVIVKRSGRCFVLELNTAPGLIGTTLERYRDELSLHIHRMRS